MFRSTDEGSHWVRVSDDDHQYGTVNVLEGDPGVFGRVSSRPERARWHSSLVNREPIEQGCRPASEVPMGMNY